MLVKYYHGLFMQDESGRKKRALGSCLADRRPRLTLRRAHDRVPVGERWCLNFLSAAEFDAFADAVAGRVPYPIPTAQMINTVAAFEAVIESDGVVLLDHHAD